MVFVTPGYSVEEIYEAGRKAKNIYNDFHDEYELAPTRIKDLVDTCDYLSRVLQDFAALLEQYGDTYPQANTFDHKIEDCRVFIASYRSLKHKFLSEVESHTFSGRFRQTWTQVWQTKRFSFDDNRAQMLKDGLSLEIQKLLTFILLFAL
jgi:hypothetical protein